MPKIMIMEGTMPMILEGTRPKACDYGGHPAPAGPALPNLINAVSMLKSKAGEHSSPLRTPHRPVLRF